MQPKDTRSPDAHDLVIILRPRPRPPRASSEEILRAMQEAARIAASRASSSSSPEGFGDAPGGQAIELAHRLILQGRRPGEQ